MNCESILNNISEAVFTVDTQLRIQTFNSAAERITGFPAEEAIGKHCSEVLGTSLCSDGCPLINILSSGEPMPDYEVVMIRMDGREMPIRVSASAMHGQNDAIVGVVVNFRDVTEIKNLMWEVVEKHTMALEENTKLEIILDSIAEGVFTINTEWKIDSFNSAAERITGFTTEEAIGRFCHEVFRSDMCGGDCALAQSLATGETVANREVNITNKNGRKVPISLRRVSGTCLR
jgi:PAS domain S-box-containing protein